MIYLACGMTGAMYQREGRNTLEYICAYVGMCADGGGAEKHGMKLVRQQRFHTQQQHSVTLILR